MIIPYFGGSNIYSATFDTTLWTLIPLNQVSNLKLSSRMRDYQRWRICRHRHGFTDKQRFV